MPRSSLIASMMQVSVASLEDIANLTANVNVSAECEILPLPYSGEAVQPCRARSGGKRPAAVGCYSFQRPGI